MKFINKGNNTVFLADIEKSVPFLGNEEQEITTEEAKKSEAFRKFISLGIFVITECGDTLFEKNLLRRQKLAIRNKIETNEDIEPSDNISKKIEVKLRGHFYELSGYAKVNRNLATGLNNEGIKIQIESVNKALNQLSEEEARQLNQISSPVSKNAIVIDSIIPTFSCMASGKYKILNTTIEASTIPKQFLDIANSYNEVWVNSDFAKKVLLDHDYKNPIFIFPNIIDNNHYADVGEKYEFNPSLKDFVFISVFGWSYRKGYDTLLKAYLKAFSGRDNVSLLIVSRNHLGAGKNDVIKNTIQKYIDNYGGDNPAHIVRTSKAIPEKHMPSLYRACNAFVLFSRGESFGNIYCEASLCGLPIIATNYSGHSMFLKRNNSFLVDVDEIRPMQQGLMQVHYWDGQMFPSLSSPNLIEDASNAMRYVFDNYEGAKNKNKILKSFISDNYNMRQVSKDVKKRLEDIWKKIN